MIYYVYTIGPCDDWEPFLSIEEYLERASSEARATKWLKIMRTVVTHARYWEGNPHTECIGALPDVDNWPIRFYCAKQPNNGTTFVVSPVPLWHLHKPVGLYREIPADVEYVEWSEAKTA